MRGIPRIRKVVFGGLAAVSALIALQTHGPAQSAALTVLALALVLMCRGLIRRWGERR